MKQMKSICVYCVSSDKINQAYIKAAYQMGGAIADRGLQL
jgi:predicted Rossmann-fold nucleotide-binding protein